MPRWITDGTARTILRWEAPGMEKAVERGLDWAGLPVIATAARLLCSSTDGPRSLRPSVGP